MILGPLQVLKRETWDNVSQRLVDLNPQVADLSQKLNQVSLEWEELRTGGKTPQPSVEPFDLTTPTKGKPTRKAMFGVMKGWTSQFEVDGVVVGGPIGLSSDERLFWHLDIIGGATNKRALELVPLEGMGHRGVLTGHELSELRFQIGHREKISAPQQLSMDGPKLISS